MFWFHLMYLWPEGFSKVQDRFGTNPLATQPFCSNGEYSRHFRAAAHGYFHYFLWDSSDYEKIKTGKSSKSTNWWLKCPELYKSLWGLFCFLIVAFSPKATNWTLYVIFEKSSIVQSLVKYFFYLYVAVGVTLFVCCWAVSDTNLFYNSCSCTWWDEFLNVE